MLVWQGDTLIAAKPLSWVSPCLTSCCPYRGAPAQAPRQRQHEVRQGDTHDSGFAATRGVPLPNQQRKFRDGPVRVKALRLGRQSGSSCVNGVSPWCTDPPVTKAHHRNDTNPPRNVKGSLPHPPNPPRPSGVTIVGPTTAIATHTTSRNHYTQGGRDTIDTCCTPGPDITTVWTYPTPVYTHTATRFANNTQSLGHRVVCPSATHMSTK